MKKVALAIIIGTLLNTFSSFGQREKESINESWKQFTGEVAGAEKVNFNDASWQTVNLPHTWNAIDAYTQRKYFKGIGWYHKNLFLTNKYIGKKLFIHFEGVFLKADVYINGKFVGEHKYPLYQPHLSQINKVANLCHYGIQKHDSVSDNGVTHSSM